MLGKTTQRWRTCARDTTHQQGSKQKTEKIPAANTCMGACADDLQLQLCCNHYSSLTCTRYMGLERVDRTSWGKLGRPTDMSFAPYNCALAFLPQLPAVLNSFQFAPAHSKHSMLATQMTSPTCMSLMLYRCALASAASHIDRFWSLACRVGRAVKVPALVASCMLPGEVRSVPVVLMHAGRQIS